MPTYNPLPNLGTTRRAPTDPARLIGAPAGSVMPPIPGLPGAGGAPAPAPGAAGAGVGAQGQLPADLLGQTAANLGGALRGELPEDVKNLIQQEAAERGIAGGISGSQAANYAGLRTLGLTSLDRMKGAEQLLAGQFLSPAQQAELEQQRLSREQQGQQFNLTLQQQKQLQQDQMALEREKLAELRAQESNRLAQQKLQFELQSLGGKYGISGGAAGGAPTRYGSGNLSPYAGLKGSVLNRFNTPGQYT